MKHRLGTPHTGFRVVCAVAFLVKLLGISPSVSAQDCFGPRCGGSVVQKQWMFDLSIVDVAPASSIEFRPITVKFTVKPSIIGIAGEVPPRPAFQVCPDREDSGAGTTCSIKYVNYRADQIISGSLTALAPMADIRPSIKIGLVTEAIPQGGEFPEKNWRAEASAPYTSSASYIVRLDNFHMLTSRAAVQDTVWATMLGLVKNNPPLPAHPSDSPTACQIVTEQFCRSPVKIGTYDNGIIPTRNVQVGPFTLTPNVEDELRFTINLTNLGDNQWVQELGNSFANGFSMAGMIALSSTAYGGAGSALHEGMTKLHGGMFASCDGPVFEQSYLVPNKQITASGETLYSMTMATGARSFTPDFIFVSNDENVRCGDDGQYRVRYSIVRTSWRDIPPSF